MWAAAALALVAASSHLARPRLGRDLSMLVRLGGWFWASSAIQLLLTWADLFIVTRVLGDTDAGLYRSAAQGALLIGLAMTSLGALYAPVVANLVAQGRHGELADVTQGSARLAFLAAATLAVAALLAPQTIMALFGEGGAQATRAFTLLVVGHLVASLGGPFAWVLTMGGYARQETLLFFATAILAVAAALVLVPRLGLAGAALAMAAGQAFLLVGNLVAVRARFGFTPLSRRSLSAVAALLLVLVAGTAARGALGPDLTAVLAAAIFAVVGLALVLTPGDRTALRAAAAPVFGARARKAPAATPVGRSP